MAKLDKRVRLDGSDEFSARIEHFDGDCGGYVEISRAVGESYAGRSKDRRHVSSWIDVNGLAQAKLLAELFTLLATRIEAAEKSKK